MDLYFVRHGSAGSRKSDVQEDAARALDQEGRQQSEAIGKLLAALNVRIDEIISSPLRRASEAAEIIARRIRYRGKIALAPALRPDGTYARFTELLSDMPEGDCILLVGHDARLAEFIGKLISNGGARVGIQLKKGAVARVVKKRRGTTLQWCLPPKLLRAYPDQDRGAHPARRSR